MVGRLAREGGDQFQAVMDLALRIAEPHALGGIGNVSMRVGRRVRSGCGGCDRGDATHIRPVGDVVLGRVQVTDPVWQRIAERFEAEPGGTISVKGSMQTFLLIGNTIWD